jgi:hypothetical protein
VSVSVLKAFEKQISADHAQGYDYVGYHSYARRRYFEMVQRKKKIFPTVSFATLFISLFFVFLSLSSADFLQLCGHDPIPFNTTCSWKGFDERVDQKRTYESWFQDCGCYMVGHS